MHRFLIIVATLMLVFGITSSTFTSQKAYSETGKSSLTFTMPFPSWGYPSYVKHCETEQVDLLLENVESFDITYTTTVIEDPSAYSSWLAVQNFNGFIPSGVGNTETGQVFLNQNGTVCNPGTVVRLSGRVIFITQIPDTSIFEVDLVIADTVVLPIWDSVTTHCNLQLTVGNNGNFGNQGVGGLNLDYVGNGEWKPEYDTYLYDAGQIIGWIDGNDTVVNWSLFQTGLADSVTLLPQGGQSHTTTSWADIAFSGEYTTNDTSISMSSKWYAPTDVEDGCNFIIKETRVTTSGLSMNGLMIGEIVDWDVPGDSTGSNNSSGYMDVDGYSVIYQQGVEMPGYDDSLESANGGWDNDQRFGAIMYLGGVKINGGGDTSKISDLPYSMYTADNSTFVYPHVLGLDGGEVYKNMGTWSISVSDSIYDLHSGVCYVFDYDMATNDTLVFFTAYITILNNSILPSGFEEVLSDVVTFFTSDDIELCIICSCCEVAADFNCSGAVDMNDLTETVTYMFRNGTPPCCQSSADLNADGDINIADLTHRIAFMFRGGPPAQCGIID